MSGWVGGAGMWSEVCDGDGVEVAEQVGSLVRGYLVVIIISLRFRGADCAI